MEKVAAEDGKKQSLADLTEKRGGGKVRTCALGLVGLTGVREAVNGGTVAVAH